MPRIQYLCPYRLSGHTPSRRLSLSAPAGIYQAEMPFRRPAHYTVCHTKNVPRFFLQLFNRPDIFPESFGVMIKIEHPALCNVKAIAGCGIIEIFHCILNFLLNITILCLIVERTVFKYNILSLRNIHYLHLFGNFTVCDSVGNRENAFLRSP